MKCRLTVLFLMITFFSFNFANAQRGQNPIPRSNDKNYDFAQASTDNLTKTLNLDGFQSAAVKTFMDDYKKEMESIGQVEMPADARTEKFNIINQKLETKILSVLNSDQKVLYENQKNKKDKKNKKGKDKKNKKGKDKKKSDEIKEVEAEEQK